MYVRNRLRAGDFVEPVPLGVPLTLVYNEYLEKVYINYEDNQIDVTDKVLTTLRSSNTVPIKVTITGATTWVRGVLYTNALIVGSGKLPDCAIESWLAQYLESPESFNFFAGHVESLGYSFSGAAAIRQWLQVCRFNILPGFIVPADLTKEKLYALVNTDQFTFTFPLVMCFISIKGADVKYIWTNLQQNLCQSVSSYLDENGYVHGIVYCDKNVLDINYSEIVKYDIQSSTLLIQDADGDIIYSRAFKKHIAEISNMLTCPVCGKLYRVPTTGECCCDDPDCLSRTYTKIKHFCNVLNLPILSFDSYMELVHGKQFITFSDMMLFDPLKAMTIEVTIPQILRAIVPQDIVHRMEFFQQFCNHCNNSWKVVTYYLNNPEKIIPEFNISGQDAQNFVKFCNIRSNVSDILAIIDSPNVKLRELDKKFDGPAIFRNKRIMITGRFNHGDYHEIMAILQSYSATVVTEFSDNIHALLVGDIKENINGTAVRNCRMLRIPVFDETDFFNTYDIDADLVQNLS